MRRASDEQVIKGSVAMRSHHDVVGGEFLRLLDDMLDGSAVELYRFGGNVLLLQAILESGEMLGCRFFAGGGYLGHVLHQRSILGGDHWRLNDR